MQMLGAVTITPTFQPAQVYSPKGLRFGSLDPGYIHLHAVPMLQLLVLSLVGLPATGDLTIAISLYCLLLEVN